ncbi:hypothetical protein H6G54_00300 [Anabaena cylindrica FACHB-243]|uniref:Uncharacterized protein n=1 Tax=Anabaena cylindrica (strain ATCC 27899 / PCC 7122) TaxID=272123 RepID=K9ZBT9_ANACC|nr:MULTISPECIES: hypothetical protein [Anabaena]AFZ56651.1 hypothetical protein Anacy_1079 [Anabaena cylindrica PCC 7122]MBD2416178.1 hypothetical protein [Anabaena cylindrica FACHB-243]MBY5285798.1 hypothetical protein [Anabaena sp. CCAP 1446/1C]MBY5311752.1 hypothetical protein [Anabaena sp. CCAP 1446/1C]MCM2408660.1 hypothetical protein [Anabaena sp. CCAP 1446/1C]
MDTTIIITIIIAFVLIVIVYLLRDRLTDLSVNGKEGTMKVKAKANEQVQDDPPVNVVFKGNKLRGEGEYRMRDADFLENDVDGKQKVELGYDEPLKDSTDKDNS